MSLFSTPKVKDPAPLPDPPEKSDAEVQAEALAERRRRRAAGGSAATFLTGGLGLPANENSASAYLSGGGTKTKLAS